MDTKYQVLWRDLRSSPSTTRALETDVFRPGLEPPTSSTECVHSSKELSGQLTRLIILIRFMAAQCMEGTLIHT